MSIIFDDVVARVQEANAHARPATPQNVTPPPPSPERDPGAPRRLAAQLDRLERREARVRAT